MRVIGKFPTLPTRCQNRFMTPVDPLRHHVARAADGDEASFVRLVTALQGDVWRLCRLLGSPADPDDLTQDTFIRVYKSLKVFRGDSTVRTWILSIARRVCADQVRKQNRHRRLVNRLVRLEPPDPSTSAPDGSLGDLLMLVEETRREAFVLTQYIGLTYEETAEVMGCAVGTVRSRVARARSDLMQAWKSSAAG